MEIYAAMTPILALAALFHDLGKANDGFQKKIKKLANTGDEYRHEWLSCCILMDFIISCGQTDEDWLSALADGALPKGKEVRVSNKIKEMPPIAALVLWLIMSHHRLTNKIPGDEQKEFLPFRYKSFSQILSRVKAQWGYENQPSASVKFSLGFIEGSEWEKKVKRYARKALEEHQNIDGMVCSAALRPAAYFMRLSLMMADYYVSAQPKDNKRKWQSKTFANTDKKTNSVKQQLDEHLVLVAEQSLQILHRLPSVEQIMDVASDIKALKRRSPKKFEWQDKVVEKILGVREKSDNGCFFVVNMASTGCGKTFANAKIAMALSKDKQSLRYFLGLGLRSLTIQTGAEYRDRIGLRKDETAVLVGGESTLPASKENNMDEWEEDLVDGEIENDTVPPDFMEPFFKGRSDRKKTAQLLFSPVVSATIDHIMLATESLKGGKWIIPFLRLATSDLVIDEVDDFSQDDIPAIARIAHTAGMLGRNLVISSATIPPDFARAIYASHRTGLSERNAFICEERPHISVWCDEFSSKTAETNEENDFRSGHESFVSLRAKRISAQPQKRKGRIIECGNNLDQFFVAIKNAIIEMHNEHGFTAFGRKISFGVVRLANINPCVACARYLLNAEFDSDTEIKVMVYHSKFPRILRNRKEQYMAHLLNRTDPLWVNETLKKDIEIVRAIRQTKAKNIMFFIVSSPVIEIGRDVDFDYAIAEPSSVRSWIQLAGRVMRHREPSVGVSSNIGLLQFNVRAVNGEKYAYLKPGYETGGKFFLKSHDLSQIVDKEDVVNGINSVPRITRAAELSPCEKLSDLEHYAMQELANAEDGLSVNEWNSGFVWVTGAAQSYHKFRKRSYEEKEILLSYKYGKKIFLDIDGAPIENTDRITQIELNPVEKSRLWLPLDYVEIVESTGDGAEKHGKMTIAVNNRERFYNDNLGMFQEMQEVQ